MKRLFENWRKHINEEEGEEANVLDLSKELDSTFCDYNPLINQYAQANPDNLAEMLIFVISTQQQRWYDVVPKFPLLMAFIKENDGLLSMERSYVDEETGKRVYDIPKSFSQLALSFRKNATQHIWENRENIYSTFKSLFDTYHTSGEDTLAREDAIFKIYLELIKSVGFGN